MPTAEENVKFLYLVLTDNGPPAVKWEEVCKELKLDKGAATKRWSRLKQAVDKGEDAPTSAQELLWLMLKNSAFEGKKHDWVRIAEACGSTPGAVSKRWSRLKKTIEQGDAPPSTAAASSTKKTPSKGKAKAEGNDDTPPVTPKRKRGSKAVCGTDSGDEEDGLEPKKAKATPKSKPRPKTAFRASDKKKASSVKTEPEDEVEDVFTDAHEHLALASSLKAESDLEENRLRAFY